MTPRGTGLSVHTGTTTNCHKQQNVVALIWIPVLYWHNHKLNGESWKCATWVPTRTPWWSVQMRGSRPSPVTSFIRPLSDSRTERRELLRVLNHLGGFSQGRLIEVRSDTRVNESEHWQNLQTRILISSFLYILLFGISSITHCPGMYSNLCHLGIFFDYASIASFPCVWQQFCYYLM